MSDDPKVVSMADPQRENPDSVKSGMPSGSLKGSIQADERLKKLLTLKDFAIPRGMPVSESTIRGIGALEELHQSPNRAWTRDQLTDLDLLTQSLSEVTYPITIENVENILNPDGDSLSYRWVNKFLSIGITLAVFSGVMMQLAKTANFSDFKVLCGVVASISLGAVGAVIYVMLPNGRINIVAGLDRETVTTNAVRIGVGGLLGYVIYLIKPEIFEGAEPLALLFPLVGGYSISLVVGILSKAVTAVELTLGLDDKRLAGLVGCL